MNSGANISVLKVRDILMVTMPADPDDSTVAALQQSVLGAMERHFAKGLILDISSVQTLDSYFARTVSETAQMVTLMGGRTIIVGMQPIVAITATQMGLALHNIETALSVDRALDMCATQPNPQRGRR
jgi:rsbT antagonist protein RsbS